MVLNCVTIPKFSTISCFLGKLSVTDLQCPRVLLYTYRGSRGPRKAHRLGTSGCCKILICFLPPFSFTQSLSHLLVFALPLSTQRHTLSCCRRNDFPFRWKVTAFLILDGVPPAVVVAVAAVREKQRAEGAAACVDQNAAVEVHLARVTVAEPLKPMPLRVVN
ncbi:unnamed protein product [Chondrus crispus]|uniref:Uncharacterized protein n=1 Tax=Chondrus crispus TaxID=2769 RepID=R7Q1Z9_CHOCR|nr:unnamed protein product [Chondrus crispus]CDF32074.1 unnamed protein product [Chondrus crispus]|eukprot:XP_005711739.1 unnamed protein product [Chondrus crispus]